MPGKQRLDLQRRHSLSKQHRLPNSGILAAVTAAVSDNASWTATVRPSQIPSLPLYVAQDAVSP